MKIGQYTVFSGGFQSPISFELLSLLPIGSYVNSITLVLSCLSFVCVFCYCCCY